MAKKQKEKPIELDYFPGWDYPLPYTLSVKGQESLRKWHEDASVTHWARVTIKHGALKADGTPYIPVELKTAGEINEDVQQQLNSLFNSNFM